MAFSRSASFAKTLSAFRHLSTAVFWKSGTPSSALSSSALASYSSGSRLSSPSTPTAHNFGITNYYRYCIEQQRQCVSCLVQPQPMWVANRTMATKLKRRKENNFDRIMQREKKVKIMMKVRSILLKQNGKIMTLLLLGKYRRDIGLTGKRRVIVLVHKYPGVFETYQESGNVTYVRFTKAALAQWEEEEQLKVQLASFLVDKVRKMIMISVDKKLTMDKIAHFKHDFGLPEDFQTNLLLRFPQFLKVTSAAEAGTSYPVVELTHWDPLLAVSVEEKKIAAEAGVVDDRPKVIIDGEEVKPTALGSRTLNFPKGLNLTRKERATALQFHDMPYISPYSKTKDMEFGPNELEKLACTTVHELLSLMVEKRTLVDHLTHLKKDFTFPKSIRATLIRHPDIFYVSFVGKRDTVFLREAYSASELVIKDPMAMNKQQLRELSELRPIRNTASGSPKASDNSLEADESDDDSEYDVDSEDESVNHENSNDRKPAVELEFDDDDVDAENENTGSRAVESDSGDEDEVVGRYREAASHAVESYAPSQRTH